MNDTENKDLAIIERYFDLDLSDNELLSFEDRLSADPSFSQKVQLFQESIALVKNKYSDKEEIRRVNKWRSALEKTTHEADDSWKYWGIAASLFMALIIGLVVYTNQKTIDYEKLAQNGWDKKIGLDYNSLRTGSDDSLKINVLTAYHAYSNQKYDAALKALQSYKSKDLYYEDALFIKSLTLYEMGQIKQSIQGLTELSKYPTGKNSKVALWYKGLIYLSTKQLDSAKSYLKIPADDSSELKLKN